MACTASTPSTTRPPTTSPSSRSAQLDAAVEFLAEVLDALETNRRYRNASPYGEPQLGSRGLYRSTGGEIDDKAVEVAYLWVLSGSDGDHDLCDIAQRSGLPLSVVGAAAQRLREAGLLEPDCI